MFSFRLEIKILHGITYVAYEWNLNLNSFSSGSRKLHKLTFGHIHLSPRLKIRVNLAVQV